MPECRTRQPRLGFGVGGGAEAAGGFRKRSCSRGGEEGNEEQARRRSLSPEAARRSPAASRMCGGDVNVSQARALRATAGFGGQKRASARVQWTLHTCMPSKARDKSGGCLPATYAHQSCFCGAGRVRAQEGPRHFHRIPRRTRRRPVGCRLRLPFLPQSQPERHGIDPRLT